jgi:prepilin-type N-terminal cleavage/methylation domain-containing protein
MNEYISIKKATYLGEYVIALKFDDDKETIVDFEHFIKSAQHPDIQKYQDPDLFKSFTIKHGDLEWNNYELAFPIYDLYRGTIEHRTDEENLSAKRSAFTMLELVMVIVVLGILAALAIPRMDRDIRQEAADNILSDIRYTQHLALVDDVTNPFNQNWQKAFWRIGFNNCASSSGVYEYIGSDKDYGGGINNAEAAADPANGKKMNWSTDSSCSAGGDSDTSNRIFLTRKYGITGVGFSTGCNSNNKYIGFDHLGRIMSGFAGSTTPNYSSYLHNDCNITFTFTGGSPESFSIIIEKETGYAYIIEEPDS